MVVEVEEVVIIVITIKVVAEVVVDTKVRAVVAVVAVNKVVNFVKDDNDWMTYIAMILNYIRHLVFIFFAFSDQQLE
jgi:hypothetical protein